MKKQNDTTAQLWIETGETRTAPLITVAPIAPIDKVYTFTADETLAQKVRIGQRVSVPFGRKGTLRPAIVVKIETGQWSSTLKPVAEILDPAGQVSHHLLELGEWIARYYLCPLGRTLAAMVPQAARRQSGFETVRRVQLTPAAEAAISAISAEATAAVRLGAKQQAIIDVLRQGTRQGEREQETSALLEEANASRASLKSLIDKGLVTENITKRARKHVGPQVERNEPAFDLNDAQLHAIERVSHFQGTAVFQALVLLGVSGSGKTEVYIRAIRREVAAKRQAIMLVPEIALTTQLVQRLAARFDRVAVIHSGLSGVERSLAWEAIRTGEIPVVIGTRSAVFAPCPNLGLIVVDEEQETSYKNLQSPRFHVRDVAIKRAHLLKIPIVLGSATPSLEAWHNQQTLATYERIDLPQRVHQQPMPAVRLVDMKDRFGASSATLSPPLLRELQQMLDRGEQAVLLLNRRGHSTWLYCPSCKRRLECPNCQVALVLHKSRNQLVCHHCHQAMETPRVCGDPSCQTPLITGGGGTQRLEEQLRSAFPTARLHRADSDTMTHTRKYQALVSAFEKGDIDILLGTQMIAKGLDFPNVSLVGVLGADYSGMADFRSAERLFQLVTQVAGRAGRAEKLGRVIVQTTSPDEPALRFATHHDFLNFAAHELAIRKRLDFPPFTRLTRFVLADRRESDVIREADALAGRLRETVEARNPHRVSILGPHPCSIERIRNQYRHEILLRAASAGEMLGILDHARHNGLLRVRTKSFVIDVDPVTLT